MRGERFLALDGLRGIAAIAVVLMHACIGALHGYLAVDLFFILSGFVIAHSYEPGLAAGRLGFGHYVRLRLERLYPMLFLGGVVGTAFYFAGLSQFTAESRMDLALAIIGQFTLIPFLAAALPYFPLNNPQWSIVWELAANFAHARWLARAPNWVLAGLVLLAALGLAWAALRLGALSNGSARADYFVALPRVGFGFLTGILLYRTRDRWFGRIPQVSSIWPYAAFLALVSMPPSVVPLGRWFGLYDLFVVVVAFVPLVMVTARARPGPAATALGTLSYPLYALNEPPVRAAVFGGASVGARLAIVAGMIVLAWIAGRYIDEALNARRRTARGKAAARSAGLAQAVSGAAA